MKITKVVPRIIVSMLCAVLIFNGLPLNAAGSGEELRHEAFLRGGEAISVALNASENTAPVSKSIAESAVPPAPTPAQAPASAASAQQQSSSSGKGMSKLMWATLIGGFAASGAVIYWVATGPGASIRNCSTCSK